MIQLPFIKEKIDKGSILLEQYEVKDAVANGYVCHRNDVNADYVLKPITADLDTQDACALQQKAAKLSENLIHQNIAHLLLATQDEKTDVFFTVVQAAQGEKLRHWADNKRENGILSVETILPILRQIANALDYAGKKGIYHPALMTDCIVVTSQGEAVIHDFDLSILPSNRLQQYLKSSQKEDWLLGYTSPERCLANPLTAVSNQYTLAVIAFELITGHLPFDTTDTVGLRDAILNKEPSTSPQLPEAQNAVLLKALAT
ncbi:MAG: protein kinase, partial [Victivallales bacterium]|nr:protein kinase [Victivallales bacterium]